MDVGRKRAKEVRLGDGIELVANLAISLGIKIPSEKNNKRKGVMSGIIDIIFEKNLGTSSFVVKNTKQVHVP